jgi:hypothetical protein
MAEGREQKVRSVAANGANHVAESRRSQHPCHEREIAVGRLRGAACGNGAAMTAAPFDTLKLSRRCASVRRIVFLRAIAPDASRTQLVFCYCIVRCAQMGIHQFRLGHNDTHPAIKV